MNKIARLSLVLTAALSMGLGISTVANALPGVKPKGASLQDLQQSGSPEISAAEQRVDQAKAQVDLANKQVNASRALLRAAQADLKAAQTEVSALKLSAAAQGLVDQTGMTPAKASPVAIAAKETKTVEETTTTVVPSVPPVAPNAIQTTTTTTTVTDEVKPVDSTAEPIQLR